MLLRIVVILALLPLVAFCAFGFLASFEPGTPIAWRIGYGIAGLMCLAGAVLAAFAKSARR